MRLVSLPLHRWLNPNRRDSASVQTICIFMVNAPRWMRTLRGSGIDRMGIYQQCPGILGNALHQTQLGLQCEAGNTHE